MQNPRGHSQARQPWVLKDLAQPLVPSVLGEAGGPRRLAEGFWSLWLSESLRAQSGGAGGSSGAPVRVGGGYSQGVGTVAGGSQGRADEVGSWHGGQLGPRKLALLEWGWLA